MIRFLIPDNTSYVSARCKLDTKRSEEEATRVYHQELGSERISILDIC